MSEADALAELLDCHDRLRGTQFDNRLLRRVKSLDLVWRKFDDTDRAAYLQGRCVVAETFDYFGMYAKAAEALERDHSSQLEHLVSLERHWSMDEWRKWKREIWLVMAKAQVKYRAEQYTAAAELLELCEQAVERLDPEAMGLFGTRARLSYFQGQVRRQVGAFEGARSCFSAAVSWATKRFRGDTPFAEISGPVEDVLVLSDEHRRVFDHARLLANWTIGKSLAFGLGWIDLTTGSLAAADMHLNAGYAMLRTTGDWIHRGYATLLLAVVQRASAGTDPTRLRHAIDRMIDAKVAFRNHPFRLRACYELAQAYLRVRSTDDARREIDEMLTALPSDERSDSQERRWRCNGLIVKSRIERIAGNLDGAERFAEMALRLAARADQELRAGTHGEAWVEAQIARGEALLGRARLAARDRADQLLCAARLSFEEALDYGSKNPKTAAVSHLHLSRVKFLTGAYREAKQDYSAGLVLAEHVEHGYVRWLASDVATEIRTDDNFFISRDLTFTDERTGRPVRLTADEAETLLHEFLVRRAWEIAGNKQSASDLLAKDIRTLRRWTRSALPPDSSDAS